MIFFRAKPVFLTLSLPMLAFERFHSGDLHEPFARQANVAKVGCVAVFIFTLGSLQHVPGQPDFVFPG